MDVHNELQSFLVKVRKIQNRVSSPKKHTAAKWFSDHVKCSFHAPTGTFAKKVKFLGVDCAKKSVANSKVYKLSSKGSSGDMERNFDDNVEKFRWKADNVPLKLRK